MEPYRHRLARVDETEPTGSGNDRHSLLGNNSSFKKRPAARQFPHSIRIVLRVLSLSLSLTIVGIIAHTMIIHNKTPDAFFTYPKGFRMRAWPYKLVMLPTYLMLGAGGIAALLNIAALITLLGVFKKVRMTAVGPISGILSCFVALGAWIAAVVYFKLWDTSEKAQFDLWSWTCTHRDIELRTMNENLGFGTICNEMRYTWYAGIAIAAIEAINLMALLYNTAVTGGMPNIGSHTQYKKLKETPFIS